MDPGEAVAEGFPNLMTDAPLPPSLHPFSTYHPASAAYRMHLSPHEWTWTQSEQEAMAEAIIALDSERAQLRERFKILSSALTERAAEYAEAIRASEGEV